MNTLDSIILIALVSIISFVIGNIFNSSVEKRFYQTQREILHERERVMHRQYKEMENALAISKGYTPDKKETNK